MITFKIKTTKYLPTWLFFLFSLAPDYISSFYCENRQYFPCFTCNHPKK